MNYSLRNISRSLPLTLPTANQTPTPPASLPNDFPSVSQRILVR